MWNAIAELVLLPVLAQAGAGVGALPGSAAAAAKPLVSYSVRDARTLKARDLVIFDDGRAEVTDRAMAGGVVAHTAKGSLAHDAMDEIGKLVDDLPDAQPDIGPPALKHAKSITVEKHGAVRSYVADAKAAATLADRLADRLDEIADKMLAKGKAGGLSRAGGLSKGGGVVGRPVLPRPGTGLLIGLPRPTILPGPPAAGTRH